MRFDLLIPITALLGVLIGCQSPSPKQTSALVSQVSSESEVAGVLDGFHEAASRADGAVYLGSMTENAVFLGTDASERWSKTQFAAFCGPYFESGTGWTYTPHDRFIQVRGNLAWADEILENESYGTCRGNAVLSRENGVWKIELYSLNFLVPNDVAKDVVATIRAYAPPAYSE